MILVTGGAGFIGSNLVEEILNQGHGVRVFDNFESGFESNLEGLNAEIVRGDLRDLDAVKNALRDVTHIYHQAALGSVPRSIDDPLSSTEVNIIGTLNILRAAQNSGVEKIVYASSSSVYAGVEELPKVETMIPIPTSIYGASKIANEHYFKIFHDIHGIRSVGMRYFNVFGPKQNPNSEYAAVIPKFIKMMMNDEKPTVFGDGEQTRDFTFVKDVVKANLLGMKTTKDDGTAYNVAGGKQISINSIIQMINEALAKSIDPQYLDPRVGDPKDSLADISRARNDLGFEPDYSFEDGMKLTVEWLKGG
jgi:UDP-glucose 4-epimerase